MNQIFWQQENDVPYETDVVVIGGGIAGCSAALHLATKKIDVILLDEGEIASRASGRNDGQVLVGMGEYYNRVVSQWGSERAAILYRFLFKNNGEFTTVIKNNSHRSDVICHGGGLHLAETESELTELVESCELMTQNGFDSYMIGQRGIERDFNLNGFLGGMVIPSEAIINPMQATIDMAQIASNFGARVFTHRKVVSVDRRGQDQIVTLEDGKEIVCNVVVHATSALATHLDKSGFLKSQIMPYRAQMMASNPLTSSQIAGLSSHAMSSNFCYEYFRVYKDHLLIGGKRWTVKGQEENTIDDSVVNPQITAELCKYVEEHMPTLRGVTFPDVWSGIIAGTSDGLPLVGEIPGQTGVFTLSAFNGYGFSFAYLAGRILANQICNGTSDEPASLMFRPSRFQ